jgi:hypothetical protein
MFAAYFKTLTHHISEATDETRENLWLGEFVHIHI